jgi:S-adenosylmethionine:diacylglycerol 3-amino-3-carboxypropyl transferase
MADSDFVTEGQMNSLVTAIGNAVEAAPRYVFHGATAGTARPSFGGTVVWVGTVAPTNAITARDFWIDTT